MQHHKEYPFFIITLKRQSHVITTLYGSEATALNHIVNNTLLHDQAQTVLKLEK